MKLEEKKEIWRKYEDCDKLAPSQVQALITDVEQAMPYLESRVNMNGHAILAEARRTLYSLQERLSQWKREELWRLK